MLDAVFYRDGTPGPLCGAGVASSPPTAALPPAAAVIRGCSFRLTVPLLPPRLLADRSKPEETARGVESPISP